MNFPKTVKGRIKYVRKLMGLSIREMSRQLGISHAHIAWIENSRRSLTHNVCALFQQKLQVDCNWLLNGQGEIWAWWPNYTEPNALNHLKKNGIQSRSQLIWLIEYIQSAWSLNSQEATTAWVAGAARCIEELLRHSMVNADEILPVLEKELPPSPWDNDIQMRIQKLLPELYSAGNTISIETANAVARCLQVLVIEAVFFKMPEFHPDLINRLSGFLTPWAFWCVRRVACDQDTFGKQFVFDMKILEQSKEIIDRHIDIEKSGVRIVGHLSKKPGFSIRFERNELATSFFPMEYDLLPFIYVFKNYKEEKEEIEVCAGRWELYTDRNKNSFTVKFGGTMVTVDRTMFDGLAEAVKVLEQDEDFIYQATDHYVRRFGAI
ncbi:MAG: hypothetical protein IEMM0002_0865 [bacterium]|nr:MAG: hypothetical protein IEMM0002_0865 [bacterium]